MTDTTQTGRDSLSTTLRTVHVGAVHRWSQTLIPTTRDAPADAEMPSHKLLVRAGYVRRVGAGIYDYLPLAWRSLKKISQIIREEMDGAGASELLLPTLEPLELFANTKRDVDYGDLLFRVTDRHGRTAALGPTHEEVITELAKSSVSSYKQLPLNLYQIQTKFRDEFRPRSALLRCREFLMKDAYSFTLTLDGPGGLREQYDAMHAAYTRIFSRLGLDFSIVEAEAGPIGGSASHEFMVNCDSGEDTILVCDASGYAANVEKCEIGPRPSDLSAVHDQPIEKHHTPGMPGIEGVAEHLGVKPEGMLKTVVFEPVEDAVASDGGELPAFVLAVVRGDHEANEGKVRDAAGFAVQLADEARAKAAGLAIGYVSPRAAALCKAMLVVDHDAAQGGTVWATGADEKDHHVTGFCWSRDLGVDVSTAGIADVRNARAGDPSPRHDGGLLREQRGIEVGHIFQLGTKYSEAFDFTVLNEEQKRTSVIMGCYGIGVSRTLAACIEMSHDDHGIVFPPAIAPYHVLITIMDGKSERHAELAAELARELSEAGADVLIDDRVDRPGVKFKDADLVGIPVRLTIGDRALEQGGVEFKSRREAGKGEVVPTGEAVAKAIDTIEAWA